MKLWLLSLAVLLSVPAQSTAPPAAFKVVVHPDNPVTTVAADQLESFYLKRATEWSGGRRVQPVDLPPRSPLRDAFARAVLGRSAAATAAYWQQQIFSGRAVPPVEMRAEADVLAFVRDNPGAVGYVAADTPAPGVKVIEVTQ